MVSVDSGEFKLMRDADIKNQPARSAVYNEWIKAFSSDVPHAVNHLADIIEDVYAFELWKDKYLDTPEEFFEQMGILGLDLEEPAKLIKALREKDQETIDSIIRSQTVKSLPNTMTQQQKANEVGLSQQHVSRLTEDSHTTVCRKAANSKNTTSRQIYLPQDVSVAAQKIRAKFGDEFANQLKELL